MATRFRKHSTRKVKARKGLKTRRHRGGSFMNKFLGKKSPLTSVAGPTAMNTAKNTFKGFVGNATQSLESISEFKARHKKKTQNGGDMASFLSKGKALLNKVTPQSMKNAHTFSSYLDTLEDQVKFKLSHGDREKMKFELMEQLREDGKILNEKRKMLGDSKYKTIREKIDKIQNYIIENSKNNNA
jgi:hypothetical protein